MDIITLVIYFFAGVVQDFFFTMNLKYVAKNKVLPAVVFSFCAVITVTLVLYTIIKNLDAERSILAIVVYSLGIALGTYLAMKTPSLKEGK